MIRPLDVKRLKVLNLAAIIILSMVVLYYYYFIITYSINFPFYDDFDAILNFLHKYIIHPGPVERIQLMFRQHNEHRLVFAKALTIIQYHLMGQVNFRLLILIGNSSLVLILVLLYKSFLPLNNYRSLFVIPVSLLLFNFRFEEVSFMAIASMQFPWVLCFALLSLYFLFKTGQYSIYLAVLFASIATFTSANGMMTFIAGALVLMPRKGCDLYSKIIWFISGLVMIALYFYGYSKPGYHPSIIEPLLHDPIGFIGYVLAFLGSAVGNLVYAISIGAGLVIFFLFLTIKKYYEENPVIYSMIIFILITAVIAALTRFGFGIEQSLNSRYAIYSSLLIACGYMAFISLMHRKVNLVHLALFISMALIFNIVTQRIYIPRIIAEKKEFDVNYALVVQGKPSNFNFGFPTPDHTINYYGLNYLKTSDSLGYFKFRYVDEALPDE